MNSQLTITDAYPTVLICHALRVSDFQILIKSCSIESRNDPRDIGLAAMLVAKRSTGVTPEVNLRECVTQTPPLNMNKPAHSGFETQRKTSPEVQSRGISGCTKRAHVLQKIIKNPKSEVAHETKFSLKIFYSTYVWLALLDKHQTSKPVMLTCEFNSHWRQFYFFAESF